MDKSEFSISNIENYFKEYEYEHSIDYIFRYIELVHQYVIYCRENIHVQNLLLHKYVIIKGLELLNTTFNILLLYTKNIDLTFHNTQKAYCYYSEFIGQIGDESNSFLNLNTQDALLFINRKLIYNIDKDIRKNFEITLTERRMMNDVKKYCDIYNNIMFKILENKSDLFKKDINEKEKDLILYIIKENTYLLNKNVNYDCDLKSVDLCEFLLEKIITNDITLKHIYNILGSFFKKYKKYITHTNHKELCKRIKQNINEIDITKDTPLKIVNGLFTNK